MSDLKRRPSRVSGQKGWSLVEVMVALMILAVGVLALVEALTRSGSASERSMQRARALDAARSWVAVMVAYSNADSGVAHVSIGDPPSTDGIECGDDRCLISRWKCGFSRWRERCGRSQDGFEPYDGGVDGTSVVVQYGGLDGDRALAEVRLAAVHE